MSQKGYSGWDFSAHLVKESKCNLENAIGEKEINKDYKDVNVTAALYWDWLCYVRVVTCFWSNEAVPGVIKQESITWHQEDVQTEQSKYNIKQC